MDMKEWLNGLRKAERKKAMPILSFPAVQLMGISVRELISDSDRQAEGMQRIAERVDAAASVSLMDLSVEAECFGSQIVVSEDEVPTVKGSIVSDLEEVENLQIPPVGAGRTDIYIDAVRKAAEKIQDRPVFAGMIGPYSLAGRLLDVTEIMFYCYDEPEMVALLLDKVTEFLISYGKAYKETGAHGIMLAEPLAGLLSPALAEEFSAPYVKRIVDALQDDRFLVIYHNCGNSTIQMIDSILDTGAAAYHFGNAIDMAEMLKHIPADTIAMGNVDPAGQFRNGTSESIRTATLSLMEKCCTYPNFVISSGCDIPPMAKWENIDAFFQAVADFMENKEFAYKKNRAEGAAEETDVTVNGRILRAAKGTTLGELLKKEGLAMPCAGMGRCGKCRVRAEGRLSEPDAVEQQKLSAKELSGNIRLACRTVILGPCQVEWETERDMEIRLGDRASFGGGEPLFDRLGAAVDVGTTTLAAQLYGKNGLLAQTGLENPQKAYGADVISRVERSLAGEGEALKKAVCGGIGTLLDELAAHAGVSAEQIDTLVITGNTSMLYLLTGRSPECLSHAPFQADWLAGEWTDGKALGLPCPDARVYFPPCISAFVGADITCAMLHTGLGESAEPASCGYRNQWGNRAESGRGAVLLFDGGGPGL